MSILLMEQETPEGITLHYSEVSYPINKRLACLQWIREKSKGMFYFLRRKKLIKDDLKGIAKLMYLDVSEDVWDKEYLTKRNLDFSIESIRFIDLYVKRLLDTEKRTELLNKHFDNFVTRIGAYIGEVIKSDINQDFYWYEFNSVYDYSSALNEIHISKKPYSLLYSKKRDIVIVPLLEVSQFLEGNSMYPNLLAYVEEMIKKNS